MALQRDSFHYRAGAVGRAPRHVGAQRPGFRHRVPQYSQHVSYNASAALLCGAFFPFDITGSTLVRSVMQQRLELAVPHPALDDGAVQAGQGSRRASGSLLGCWTVDGCFCWCQQLLFTPAGAAVAVVSCVLEQQRLCACRLSPSCAWATVCSFGVVNPAAWCRLLEAGFRRCWCGGVAVAPYWGATA